MQDPEHDLLSAAGVGHAAVLLVNNSCCSLQELAAAEAGMLCSVLHTESTVVLRAQEVLEVKVRDLGI